MSVLVPGGAPITAQITLGAGQNALIAAATQSAIDARQHGVVAMKVTALAANTGKVYLGDVASVTTANGDEIPAGSSVTVDTNSPAKFGVAGTTNDKVSILLLLAG
jgi:hypothetical protein